HRVVTGQPLQPPRKERLEDEVTAILLPYEHDKRRAVHARGRERTDRVTETRRRVHDDERRLAACDREPGREGDDRVFVQRQHEATVVGKAGENRHCGDRHSCSIGAYLAASSSRRFSSSFDSSCPRFVVTSPTTTCFSPLGRKRSGSKPPERWSSHSMKKPSTSSSFRSASATK